MKDAFSEVTRISYEGPKSKNPLSFKHYNATEVVDGKTMREHLRFSVAYWHSFRNMNADPFGVGTRQMPWDDGSNSVENAQNRARVAFEFMRRLLRDIAEGRALGDTTTLADATVVAKLKSQYEES